MNESIHNVYTTKASKRIDFATSYTARIDVALLEYARGALPLYKACCEQFEIRQSSSATTMLERLDEATKKVAEKRKTPAYKAYKVQSKKRKTDRLTRSFMRNEEYTYVSIDQYEDDDDGL